MRPRLLRLQVLRYALLRARLLRGLDLANLMLIALPLWAAADRPFALRALPCRALQFSKTPPAALTITLPGTSSFPPLIYLLLLRGPRCLRFVRRRRNRRYQRLYGKEQLVSMKMTMACKNRMRRYGSYQWDMFLADRRVRETYLTV